MAESTFKVWVDLAALERWCSRVRRSCYWRDHKHHPKHLKITMKKAPKIEYGLGDG